MEETLYLTPVVLRMLERILITACGGLSIYLGYRLFIKLPVYQEQEGELKLGALALSLTKVGPGIFFSAFGCIVLSYSLMNPINTQLNSPAQAESLVTKPSELSSSFIGIGPGGQAQASDSELARQRALNLAQVERLNCMLSTLRQQHPEQAVESEIAVTHASSQLLLAVWDESWGHPKQLEFGRASLKSPQLLSLYEGSKCSS